ncbi:MAG: hypothetical protein Q8N63_03395 [Nanoarchaeota archaeon]|nr:hypothetical protein [Nanoarchaeota archaeon]
MTKVLEDISDLATLFPIGIISVIFVGPCIENSKPIIITENVRGNKIPDKFYYVMGKRVYLEIDGKSVEDYFKSKDKNGYNIK